MNRRSVRSSNVSSLGWDDGVLEVEFKGGEVYRYDGVPEAVYGAALGASSVGKFISQNVVGTYESEKVP